MIGRTNSGSMSNATAALDFTVVDGLTEPVNPKEKTIWIATDEEITSWAFSATEPAAQQGLVWFLVGQSSSVAFSVTKDNPIMVYPIKAQQYINNSWVEKTTKIYLNNEWVTWYNITYWFKYGEGPTNTWETKSSSGASVGIDTNQFHFLQDWVGSQVGQTQVTTNFLINISNFNKLYFDAIADGGANATFGVSNSMVDSNTDINFIKSIQQSSRERKLWELDISTLTGSFYIAMRGNGAGSIWVYNIYGS